MDTRPLRRPAYRRLWPSTVVGATRPHHLDDAVAALDITLTDKEIEELERPYTPRAISGH